MKIYRCSRSLGLLALAALLPALQGWAAGTRTTTNAAGDIVSVRRGNEETASAGLASESYREGELLVRFKPSVSESRKRDKHRRHRSVLVREHRKLRLQHLRLNRDLPVPEALARYREDPDVEYAEPNYLVSTLNTPNDPRFGQLWGLARIQAPTAWDITTGDGSAVVAILDTGIDYSHPDLIPNLWVNPGELGGSPDRDNDGDGYPGDLHGYNAITRSGDPKDDHYHGTHVAGTIAAAGNNGTGVAGVAWQAKLLACKFLDANGSGSIEDAVACLEYVKSMRERGVNIVATNNSWGSPSYSQALYDAIRDQGDILFIAAAGNDNSKLPSYPAAYDLPNVISVAASDEADQKAAFSNYGRSTVHLAAPGNNIQSTFPGQGYGTLSGTSMATPHVAGLAALLKSQDPARTAPVLKNLILAGGDPLPAFADLTATGRRLNAYQSLSCQNRPLFAILHAPEAPQQGVPQTVSALSVNCGTPVGPVTLTLSGGGTVQLHDDGLPPDQAAGDGVFTGSWTPGGATETLSFASPLGSAAVSSPPVSIGDQPSVLPPAQLLPGNVTSAASHAGFSQRFPTSGGIAPFTWSIVKGALPPGLSLDSRTGEIAGVTGTAGDFGFTIQVVDALGVKDSREWTLVVNDSLRSGWPRELQLRTGTGMLAASAAPVLADLEGDGRDEVVASDVDTLYLFYPDGGSKKVLLPGSASTPAVADLDGDGRQEIVVSVSNGYTSGNTLYAFHADLTPVAGFPAGSYPSYNGGTGYVSAPVIADFEGEGEPAIAVVASPNNINDPNFGKNCLLLVDRHGETLPGWPRFFGKSGSGAPPAPALADLEGDGHQQLVVTSSDGYLRIFGADGTLVRQWAYDSGPQAGWSPLVADLDGDGRPDIVVKYQSGAGANVIGAFDRNGTPLPDWPRVLPGPGVPVAPVLADLDGDGRPELIAVAGSYWNEIHALRADGGEPAGWPVTTDFGIGYPWFDCSPVAADLDGDGRQELLIAGVNQATSGVLLAYGADGAPVPGFPKYASAKSEVRSSPAIGDLDGNGRLDIVLKSENGMLHAWEMQQAQELKNLQWPMYGGGPRHPGSWLPGSRTTVTGAPGAPSNLAAATLTVGGTGFVSYRYRFDDGGYSAELPVAAPIVLSALAEGRHTVSVVGRNGSGTWQAWPSVASWLVDLTPPATTATPGTGVLPDSGSVTLACGDPGGSGCAATRYCLGAGCRPELPYLGAIALTAPTELRFSSSDLAGNSEPVRSASYTSLAPQYRVALRILGSGAGSVTSTPAGIEARADLDAWGAGGSTLVLRAAPAPFSLFAGWSGSCGGTGDCPLSLRSDQEVAATFVRDSAHVTYIPRAPGIYNGDLQAAYRSARDGDTIRVWGITLEGDLSIAEAKAVTIRGGYDQGYGSRAGVSALRGTLRISGGTISADHLVLR